MIRRKAIARLLGLIAALVLTSIAVGSSTLSPSPFNKGPKRGMRRALCANPIFASVIERLQSRTRVPLRLPLTVGDDYDAALYARVSRVNRERYLVRIGQNCERGYCPYGTVSGTKLSRATLPPRGKAVELAGGITGYLTDGSRRLKDSTITWDQGRYRYSISVYAKEPEAMIRMATSAASCTSSEC